MTSALSSDAARGWPIRVPHGVIAAGLPLTVVIMIVFASSDDTYVRTVEEAVSLRHMVIHGLSMLTLGAALLAWAVPRVCMAVFVIGCLVAAVVGGDANEVAAGLVWAPIAALDGVLALRQQAIAADWPREHAMITDHEAAGAMAGFWRWESLGLAVLAMIGAVMALGWWVNGRADLIAFDDRAVAQGVVITRTDAWLDTVYADVNGKEREFWVDDASTYLVGDDMTVRVDPQGEFSPMGPDDADPRAITDIGALFAPLMFLGLLLIFTPRHRGRQALLAAADQRPVRALVRPSLTNDEVVEIMTTDGRVIAIACGVTHIGDADELDWDNDDEGLLIIGEGPNSYQVDLSSLPPDSDLDEWLEEPVSEPETEATQSADTSPESALIFGLERYGRSVLIQLTEDRGTSPGLLLPARPLRDPYTVKALLSRVPGLDRERDQPTSQPGAEGDPSEVAPISSRASSMVHSSLAATRTFGPLAGLVGIWFAVWWLNEPVDPSIWDILGGAAQGGFVGLGFAQWFALERPLARLGRLGVMLPGTVLDRLVPDHRLVSIRLGKQSATIALRAPDERVGIIVDPESPHVEADLAELERVVNTALARRRPAPEGWSLPRSIPGPGGMVVLASALVGASAIVFG